MNKWSWCISFSVGSGSVIINIFRSLYSLLSKILRRSICDVMGIEAVYLHNNYEHSHSQSPKDVHHY